MVPSPFAATTGRNIWAPVLAIVAGVLHVAPPSVDREYRMSAPPEARLLRHVT
jgi:hypothetical protein